MTYVPVVNVNLYTNVMGKTIKHIKVKDVNTIICVYDFYLEVEFEYYVSNAIIIEFTDNTFYCMFHKDEGSENVYIHDICGDLNDLIGNQLLVAEEVHQQNELDEFTTNTWTFYKFYTNKGTVTINWVGISNGQYSETVSFQEISNELYYKLNDYSDLNFIPLM